MLAEVTARLRELHTTIEAGDMHRHTLLSGVASRECFSPVELLGHDSFF